MKNCWILLADSHRARLLRGSRTGHGRQHLEELGEVQYEPMEREHGRPKSLAGMNGHSYASFKKEEDESRRRFAKKVSEWLDQELRQRWIDRVHVFAPAPFLAVLEREVSKDVAGRMTSKPVELAKLRTAELVEHPAVVECFSDV